MIHSLALEPVRLALNLLPLRIADVSGNNADAHLARVVELRLNGAPAGASEPLPRQLSQGWRLQQFISFGERE